MRGTSQLPDLQVCLLSWLLSLHVSLKWQPSHLGGLHLLDVHAHMHHPQRAEAGVCEWQWISWVIHTNWIMLPRAGWSLGYWCSGSAASSSLPPRLPAPVFVTVRIPSADFDGRRQQVCPSLMAAEVPVSAVLQRMIMPELPLAWVFDGFKSCFFFFFSVRKSCQLQVIASFSDRLSQEQCKWALKCGDLVYICQLIAWVA